MERTEISKKINAILDNYGVEAEQITMDASFYNDLGLDSLDFAELTMSAEQVFEIVFSDDEEDIQTIGDLVNNIEALLNASSSEIKQQNS